MRTGTPTGAATAPDPEAPDRRREDLGPPPGVPERRKDKDPALKMKCPFCPATSSRVWRSRGVIVVDAVRRTRKCLECGETFPTKEEIDWEALNRRRRPKTAA